MFIMKRSGYCSLSLLKFLKHRMATHKKGPWFKYLSHLSHWVYVCTTHFLKKTFVLIWMRCSIQKVDCEEVYRRLIRAV